MLFLEYCILCFNYIIVILYYTSIILQIYNITLYKYKSFIIFLKNNFIMSYA
jgi:hypothetical protein